MQCHEKLLGICSYTNLWCFFAFYSLKFHHFLISHVNLYDFWPMHEITSSWFIAVEQKILGKFFVCSRVFFPVRTSSGVFCPSQKTFTVFCFMIYFNFKKYFMVLCCWKKYKVFLPCRDKLSTWFLFLHEPQKFFALWQTFYHFLLQNSTIFCPRQKHLIIFCCRKKILDFFAVHENWNYLFLKIMPHFIF